MTGAGLHTVRTLARSGIVVTFVGAVALFSLLRTEAFFNVDNALTIVTNTALIGIVAAGVTVPLIMHEFDLTASALISFAGMLVATAMSSHGVAWPVALAGTVIACALIGGAVGAIVASNPGSSFILTLGAASVIGGLELWRSDGEAIFQDIPLGFMELGQGKVADTVQVPVLLLLAVGAVLWLLLGRTETGLKIQAVAGNRDAAVAAGIRVRRLIVLAFLISAALAGFAGVMSASQAGAYYPAPGMGVLLSVFTAAFLGAAAAGRFSVVASIFGALYLTVITTGLQMLGVEHWVALFVQGMTLVVAIALARIGGAGTAGPTLAQH